MTTTAWQTCALKVPEVTTPKLSHSATDAHDSCLQRSSEVLEYSQVWLESFLSSYRLIRWEIVTSGQRKHRERHASKYARACYLRINTVSHAAVATNVSHVGTKVRDPLSSFFPAAVKTDSVWHSRFVPTFTAWTAEAGAMGKAVNSIDVLHSNPKWWRTSNG